MTKPQNLDAIEKATNRTWDEWEKWLKSIDAATLDHTKLARRIYEELEGSVENAGWWSQGVAVAYEQSIGRRAPGQRSDGSFEFSLSKTVEGTREDVYAKSLEFLTGVTDFAGKKLKNERTSVTDVRSYWRCDLEDGSKVSWAFEERAGKVIVSVTHANLTSSKDAASWRAFWKNYLTEHL